MRNVVCANARFAVNIDRQSVTATHSNLPGLIAWFIGSLQPYNEDRKRVVCNVVTDGFVPDPATAHCDK
jgi:hypothetical protein